MRPGSIRPRRGWIRLLPRLGCRCAGDAFTALPPSSMLAPLDRRNIIVLGLDSRPGIRLNDALSPVKTREPPAPSSSES